MLFLFVNLHNFSGGAISNLYAVLTARHKHFPSCKRRGLNNLPTLVMFTSEHVSTDVTRKIWKRKEKD